MASPPRRKDDVSNELGMTGVNSLRLVTPLAAAFTGAAAGAFAGSATAAAAAAMFSATLGGSSRSADSPRPKE